MSTMQTREVHVGRIHERLRQGHAVNRPASRYPFVDPSAAVLPMYMKALCGAVMYCPAVGEAEPELTCLRCKVFLAREGFTS